ncbi:MAG: VOC family protein [Acetobacteraceae bacterium]|nr:VOC family protein [Acetobacteraceae bacterium]
MFAPIPTLDHVVVNVRDQMDEAVEVYRGLGFTMTPRGYHTLGSMNHLAMFGTDYLELIAADPKAATPRADVMQFPCGLNGLVFGTEDSAATYAACAAAGVPVQKPVEFSRPVELPGGARDAVFRTVHLDGGTIPAGRVYFCQHFTRDLVWRDEWRHHANGVIGIAAVVMVADDVDAPAAVFARMFGRDAVGAIKNGVRLAVGLTSVEIISPGECAARYGEAAPDGAGRAQYMAGLVLRSRNVSRVVPAGAAMGAVLDLRVG